MQECPRNLEQLHSKKQKMYHQVFQDYSTLREYHSILYKLSNGHGKLVKLIPKGHDNIHSRLSINYFYRHIKLDKWNIVLQSDQLIGLYYEMPYQIILHSDTLIYQCVPFTRTELEEFSDTEDESIARDNRDLFQNNNSQTLTPDQIQNMKSSLIEGNLSPEEMIQTIAENSVTFHKKTEFSQDKYLKKKEKKFQRIIQFFAPSGHILCQHYLLHKPEKILYMKQDVLSQLLSCSDIHTGTNILLIDETCGLLTGSVLERSSAHSKPLESYDQTIITCVPSGNLFIMDNFNFSQDQKSLCKILRSISELKDVNDNSIDACIIASMSYNPLDLLKICQRKVKSSRQILIYSQYKESLLPIFSYAMSGSFVNVQLSESITRQYQILPERFHPHMVMTGRSGFILSMTTVLDCID